MSMTLIVEIAAGILLSYVGLLLWPLTIVAGAVYGVGKLVGLW